MGCTSCSLDSFDDNAFSGLYFAYKDDFSAMLLQEYESRKMYKIFVEMKNDTEGDHSNVPISNVLDYFSLNNPAILRRLLAGIDLGRMFVTYRELVIAVWSICSLPEKFAGAYFIESSSSSMIYAVATPFPDVSTFSVRSIWQATEGCARYCILPCPSQ